MKALWIDSGNDPAYERITAAGIKWLFFAGTDQRVTKPYLASVAARGYQTGIYFAWNWYPTQASFVGDVLAKMKALRVSNSSPKLQLDVELHDAGYVISAINSVRAVYPNQDLSWTMESFQAAKGGWWTDALTQCLIDKHVRVVPQFYRGQMAQITLRDSDPATFWKQIADEQVAQVEVAFEIENRGIPRSVISGCYDAACLPSNGRWSGWSFTQGRLPNA